MVPITIIAVSSCFYFLYSFLTWFSSMRKWKKDFALPFWNTNLFYVAIPLSDGFSGAMNFSVCLQQSWVV